MTSTEEIKERIEENLPGAKVNVENPRNDGRHFQVEVVYQGFEGKPLLQQHKMVYTALGMSFDSNHGETLHAMELKTKSKE